MTELERYAITIEAIDKLTQAYKVILGDTIPVPSDRRNETRELLLDKIEELTKKL